MSKFLRVSGFTAMLLTARIAAGEVELFQLPEAERLRDEVTAESATTSLSLTSGDAAVVSIRLDDSGVADWRFLNPRKPQSVGPGTLIQFVNETSDRTFEVTTKLSLPADLAAENLPATASLAIYDGLIDGRKPPQPLETIGAYETRLIAEAKQRFPKLACILDHVVAVEAALRDRAAKLADEKSKRSNLLAVSGNLNSRVVDIESVKNLVKTAEEARKNADTSLRRIKGTKEEFLESRKDLADEFSAKIVDLGKDIARSKDPQERSKLSRRIALIKIAADVLKNQSEETARLIPLRQTFPSMRMEDCTAGAMVSCTASIYVYPNGSETFSYETLIYQVDPTGPAIFNIKFFEEDETPARSVAYLVAEENDGTTGPPRSVATLQAVASVGAVKDPFLLSRSATSRNCPFVCKDLPHDGAERSRMTGSGRIDFTQTYSNLLDGKVSLSFKEGDLGGGAGTVDVKLAQYRFNLYSTFGATLHYGKYQFLAPSLGVAINETGEGVRLAYLNLALTRIIKRESGTNVADRDNRDNSVWVLEANSISLTDFLTNREMALTTRQKRILGGLFRTVSVVALRGEDRKGPETRPDPATKIEETVFTAHTYETYGGNVGFTRPGVFYGSLAGYWSQRKAEEKDAPCGNVLHVCDGRGSVGLLTLTRPFRVGDDGKSKGNITFTAGIGSADDPSTLNKDEGYTGETASFVPDQIFLATLAGAISTRDFIDLDQFKNDDPALDRELKEQFRALDIGANGIGPGLSNKSYYGLKFVHNGFSLLEKVAFFIPKSDIRSRATFITLHHYNLRSPLEGHGRDAGLEADLEFNVETPRGVKINLKGAYYWAGEAVKTFITDDTWSLAAGISLSL